MCSDQSATRLSQGSGLADTLSLMDAADTQMQTPPLQAKHVLQARHTPLQVSKRGLVPLEMEQSVGSLQAKVSKSRHTSC